MSGDHSHSHAHQHSWRDPHAAPGSASVLDIGGDVGAIIVRLPDEKSHFCGVPRFNLHYHLHGGTRVKACANVAC